MWGWPVYNLTWLLILHNNKQKINTWHRHFGHIALPTRVKVWPPLHIPIVVVGGGVGLVDFGDGDLTILGFPTLGGLFDLPGLPFGGRVIDLYVYVSHCRIRGAWFCNGNDITERGRDPNSNGEYRWVKHRNYSRMFSARDGGGSSGFKFGWVTERAGARAAFPYVRRIACFLREQLPYICRHLKGFTVNSGWFDARHL